ncbi:MAG TPA: YggS family pyridoxal phosphate-dependent enzyme [Candidatus Omnitrophota bacterium]|nr:YggS family pyridoxal phosphate-dependent enzyme [Candidatus Omnitrophota bacterium]
MLFEKGNTIGERLAAIREEISRIASSAAGRDSNGPELIAITKNVEVGRIFEAYRAGQRHFGENRVQELLEKQNQLPRDIQWHFVGRLQTNKVKAILGKVSLIHSVDSLRLAEEIEKRAEPLKEKVSVLIQVRTTDEETKQGVLPEELPGFLKTVSNFTRLKAAGLMTIGPLTTEEDAIRKSFRALKLLLEKCRAGGFEGLRYLSMGMTEDYRIAVEEGAHFLRIGRAIFGERKTV